MNIAPISNTVRTIPKKNNLKQQKSNNVSFKSIFLERGVDVGKIKEGTYPARFEKREALLLNRIAQDYPNQDCFILEGFASKPRLAYRERPVEVQWCYDTAYSELRIDVDPDDKQYPCEPLILYPDSSLNFIIGVPSYISNNPSLPYTVKAGYELHKKLIEKKYQIMDVIGRTDAEDIDFGGETIIEKAHKAIEETEIAVTRYLVECAYMALTDRASARQIYESNFPKAQTRLDLERRLDLTTSLAAQDQLKSGDTDIMEKMDICAYSTTVFPNTADNKKRINDILSYMYANGITLDNPEHL